METKTQPITTQLYFARSTKGTHVFVNQDPGAAVTNLYVARAALGPTPPAKLTLTVAAATDG